MTTVQDIYRLIDGFAPFETAMDFDNCGILVGDGNTPVSKALAALDITKEVIEEAAALGAQLIISHHPVIFQPLRALGFESPAALLVKHNLSALCAHTNLDLSPKGVNICLAKALGLEEIILVEGQCMATGTLGRELGCKAFAQLVKERLGCKGVRYTCTDKPVRTVAVSSGAGGSAVSLCGALGADALVTGEVKHHEILEARAAGTCVVDAGHFKTETVVIKPLVQILAEAFPSVTFIESAACTDGVAYV